MYYYNMGNLFTTEEHKEDVKKIIKDVVTKKNEYQLYVPKIDNDNDLTIGHKEINAMHDDDTQKSEKEKKTESSATGGRYERKRYSQYYDNDMTTDGAVKVLRSLLNNQNGGDVYTDTDVKKLKALFGGDEMNDKISDKKDETEIVIENLMNMLNTNEKSLNMDNAEKELDNVLNGGCGCSNEQIGGKKKTKKNKNSKNDEGKMVEETKKKEKKINLDEEDDEEEEEEKKKMKKMRKMKKNRH